MMKSGAANGAAAQIPLAPAPVSAPSTADALAQHPLLLRLSLWDELTAADRDAVLDLTSVVRTFYKGEDIVKAGAIPQASNFLMSGFASRYQLLEDGRRQITAIHVDGDFMDLHGFLLKPLDHQIGALTVCRVAIVPHTALSQVIDENPRLTKLFWLSTLVDAAMHRQWMVGMGRRSTLKQVAHLLCELRLRLRVVQRATGNEFPLPLTQIDLADALGLSVVHVNRTFRQLREKNIALWSRGAISILDWAALTDLAEFDPTYLQLDRRIR